MNTRALRTALGLTAFVAPALALAHVGGNGAAGIVAATVTVHRPTGRVVEEWTAWEEVILGEPVSDLKARGYTVTPWAT